MGEGSYGRLYVVVGFCTAVFEEHLVELVRLLLQFDLIDRGLGEDLVSHQVLVLI